MDNFYMKSEQPSSCGGAAEKPLVTVTDDARAYIKDRCGGAIYIDLVEFGGCGGFHVHPMFYDGKPEGPENYDLYEFDGAEVYLYKGAESEKGKVEIYLEIERLTFKSLQVSGLKFIESSFELRY